VVAGPSSGDKLSSKDIFGDMLEELTTEPEAIADPELDAAFAADPGSASSVEPKPSAEASPTTNPLAEKPTETPKLSTTPDATPATPSEAPRKARKKSKDDLQKKLEETLSGVLSPELLNPELLKAKARPSGAGLSQDTTDVDKLLSDTLSGLAVGGKRRKSPKKLVDDERVTEKTLADQTGTDWTAADETGIEDTLKDLEASILGDSTRSKPSSPSSPKEAPTVALEAEAFEADPVEDLAIEGFLVDEELPEESPSQEEPANDTVASLPPLLEVASSESDLPAPEISQPGIPEPELTEPEIHLAEIEDELSQLEESLALPEEASAEEVPPSEEASPVAGQQFGHYTLLERIAVGGMAEVWKARMDGVAGFQKTVAIKKILPHLTENDQFQAMFVDEARLAAELNHPNITHIYDLGVLQSDYYIAMEYVEGRNLRSILNLASRKGMPIPHDLALLIASRLASALDYAHRKRDAEDQELGLVHRDVSPQNVLISYEGDIKLCDFGIVKAVSKLSKTESGALKGKLQYMSPEQAWGRDVDSRSDIFSIGALLFEMLTGLRLFSGDTELSVLEAVRSGRTRRPRDFDPTIPDAVDDLVARAVAQEPVDRFQRAGRMRDQIESIFEQLTLRPSNAELAAYLRRLISAPDVDEDLDSGPTGRIEKVARFALPKPGEEEVAKNDLAAETAEKPEIPFVEAVPPMTELPAEEPKSRRGLLIATILLLLALGVAAAAFLTRDRSDTPPPATTESTARETPPAPEADSGTDPQGDLEPATGEPKTDLESSAGDPARDLLAQERERIQEEVSAQVAAQEEELRKTYEAKEKQLKSKLASLEQAQEEEAAAASGGGEVVPPGPGVEPPVLVSIDKPKYSAGARQEAGEKEVVLYLLVNQNGKVEQVRQAQGSNLDPGVNEAAIRAARAAVFKPATKDGRQVKMWTTLKIPLSP